MAGIQSFGAYVPRYRLDRKVIWEQMGWYNSANAALAKGEKAMANYDEDTISMAVEAARGALSGYDTGAIDSVSLASLSLPFQNRLNAGVVAGALQLKEQALATDTTASARCGTSALLQALEAGGEALVCASDARRAQPGSAAEYTYGDGAAAVVTTGGDGAAQYCGGVSLHEDFIDVRRPAGDAFDHGWEERWTRDEGYTRLILKAVKALCQKYDIALDSFAAIALAVPSQSAWKAVGRKLGAAPEQLVDPLLAAAGDTGAAQPLLMLCAALENAKPGDNILLVGYGYGADALWFRAGEGIAAFVGRDSSVAAQLARKKSMPTYGRYLVYKDLLPIELGIRGESIAPTAMTVAHRLGKAAESLQGVRCTACGTPQFPALLYCPKCGAHGQMEPYDFSGRKGIIASFTGDSLAFSLDPPQHYGLVDFEGGGRLYLEYTDCETDELDVGLPVRLTFRVKHRDPGRGVIQYFWKAVPQRGDV